MKFIKCVAVCSLLIPAWLFGAYNIEGVLRYGYVDTGPSTKHLTSPELTVLRTIDERGTHAMGISYTSFRWNDSHKDTLSIYPPVEFTTDVKVRWNVFLLDYNYTVPVSSHLTLYLSPRIGAAQATESVSGFNYGGIIAWSSYRYSLKTSWCLAAEAQLGAIWNITSHWNAHLGVSATYIRSKPLPLTESLRALQGIGGLGFSF